MGFVTGFTGGVTLTLSIAYLSALAHQRNREQQGRTLRHQALELQRLIDPIPEPLPPTRSEVAAAQRAKSIEVVKDQWNDEVVRAVHWVQNTDWDEVRESTEAHIGSLWTRLFGQSPAESVVSAKEAVEPKVQQAASKARQQAGRIGEATRGAFDDAKEKGRSVQEAAESKALEARLKAKTEVSKLEDAAKDKTEEAKGALASLFGKGKEKAGELVDRAKTAVGVAESKAGAVLDGKALVVGMSPVEKALHQRYEKSRPRDARTVSEVLRERYIPVDERDNSVLRGL